MSRHRHEQERDHRGRFQHEWGVIGDSLYVEGRGYLHDSILYCPHCDRYELDGSVMTYSQIRRRHPKVFAAMEARR